MNQNQLLHVLLGLLIIIITARLLNVILKRAYQPQVVCEMLAGILIGPSFLGLIAPDLYHYVIPANIIPSFGVLSQIGIILYMFLIGMEFDFSILKNSNQSILAISQISIILPFILGIITAFWLFNNNFLVNINNESVSFVSFALFIGVSMSITAFPVLARILSDQNLNKSALGHFALTCAAVNDITAWCLLALVVGVMQSLVLSAILTIILTIIYIIIMLFLIKPLAQRTSNYLIRNTVNYRDEQQIAFLFIALLISALITEYIGIHAIFGAFLFGIIIPRNNQVINNMANKLKDVISIIFLPAFFAYIGMKTQINLITSIESWLICVIIIAIATIGKFCGTYLIARLYGMQPKLAVSLGFLMNTRGLVELIVLNIGLELGIINQQLFTILVIMAIVTTCMTGPALHLLAPKKLTDL